MDGHTFIMTSGTFPELGSVSTHTALDSSGSAREVILIPLPRNALGTENTYPPPTPDEDNLSNWARSAYFFLNGDVMAQVPRNASDLPLDQSASEITDVVQVKDEIRIYYPVTREEAVCITWVYPTDEWTATYAEVELHDGSIALDSLDTPSASVVWSINPEKYTD